MAPSTRSRTRGPPLPHAIIPPDVYIKREASSEPEDFDDSCASDFDDDDSDTVQSPTRLTYRLDHLPERTKTAVREIFTEPPKIAIEKCRRTEDTYAFQMTELVTRTVRIKSPASGPKRLMCSCNSDKPESEPCEHQYWLLDQLVKQTLYTHDQDKPLTMTPNGFAQEMGDPFQNLVGYHLDVLAQDLRCQHLQPEKATLGYSQATHNDENVIGLEDSRLQDSRQLLSSIYGQRSEEFRPELFKEAIDVGNDIIQPQDLDFSILRMLLDNSLFFQYFLSKTKANDAIHDPFIHLTRRIDMVLRDLDRYSTSFYLPATSPPATPAPKTSSTETPQDVTWAAKHITGVIRIIKSYIYSQEDPIPLAEAACAARALVHILQEVVNRPQDCHPGANRHERNLYLRLIGDKDENFIIRELRLIPGAASQYLDSLEAIVDEIKEHGAPVTYVGKFADLNESLRRHRSRSHGQKVLKRSATPIIKSPSPKLKRVRE